MLKITGKHIDVTDAIREHSNEQFNKISEHIDISEKSISFGKERHLFSVVASAETRDGFSATGTSKDKDCYKAITEAVRKLEKQLEKHRAKLKEHSNEKVIDLDPVEDEVDEAI